MSFPRENWAQIASTDVMDKRNRLIGAIPSLRGRPRGEERRIGCKRRQAAYSCLAGLRRSRTPPLGARDCQRATNCSYDVSAVSAIWRS